MIVTPDNQFVTARAYPKFLLIRPEIDGNLLKLSAPGKPQIIVNIVELQNEESRKAVVWSQEINAVDAGDNVAQWISSFVLGTDDGFRLVYYVPKVPTRDVRGKNRPFKNIKNIDAGALHDATGYMLINQASIDDLNGRIDHIVKPLQFRPNIVIKGPDAWEEDHWKWIRVGDVVFRNIKPCTRCIFTNINPDNAERDPKQQVLKTLKEYRSIVPNDSPVMGIHIGLRGEGTLSIGDQVFIGVDEWVFYYCFSVVCSMKYGVFRHFSIKRISNGFLLSIKKYNFSIYSINLLDNVVIFRVFFSFSLNSNVCFQYKSQQKIFSIQRIRRE